MRTGSWTGFLPEVEGPDALTPNAVEPIPTLGARFPRGGPVLTLWSGRPVLSGRARTGPPLDCLVWTGTGLLPLLKRHLPPDLPGKWLQCQANGSNVCQVLRRARLWSGRARFEMERLVLYCRTTSASTAPRTPRRTCCPYAYVLITVLRVSHSCEHFPDGLDLHLLTSGWKVRAVLGAPDREQCRRHLPISAQFKNNYFAEM